MWGFGRVLSRRDLSSPAIDAFEPCSGCEGRVAVGCFEEILVKAIGPNSIFVEF